MAYVNLIDLVYPIGSFYITNSSTCPSTLFGGSWSQVTGKYLKASSTSQTAGSTGGTSAHRHTGKDLSARIGSTNASTIQIGFAHDNRYVGDGYNPTYYISASSYGSGGYFSHYTSIAGNTSYTDIELPYYSANIWYRTA